MALSFLYMSVVLKHTGELRGKKKYLSENNFYYRKFESWERNWFQ